MMLAISIGSRSVCTSSIRLTSNCLKSHTRHISTAKTVAPYGITRSIGLSRFTISPKLLFQKPSIIPRFTNRNSIAFISSTPINNDDPPRKRRLLPKLSERENITNLPNLLTVSRLIAAPIIGYLILHDQHALAVGLLAYASITDYVDGYIARNWNMKTVIGTVLDPLADKSLMTILTVTLAMQGSLPIWLACIILGRDLGMGVAAIYFRWISLPPPKTFTRYWDFSLPSAEVKPTQISKINTALQLLLLISTTAHPLITMDVSTALTSLQYIVATTTIWSGASYIYTKDTIRILPQEQKETKQVNSDKIEGVKNPQDNTKPVFGVLKGDIETRDSWMKEKNRDLEHLKEDFKK